MVRRGEETMGRNASKYVIALLVAAAPFFAVACGTTYSSPPPESGSGDIQGARYETMRVLSERLVDRLQITRDELRNARAATGDIPLLEDLLDRARRFRDRMSDYSNPARYIQADVDELDRMARDLDNRTRYVQASQRAVDNWNSGLDVIDRMKRVLAGQDVEVPPAVVTSGGGTYPNNPTYPTSPTQPTYPTSPTQPSYGSVLSGSALDDFRRNAHEVVVRATLARDTAERTGGGYNDSARRIASDMSYFVSGARDLDTRASASSVDRRDARNYVDRLFEDARRIDRSMRDANVYSGAWTDWSEVLRLLQRLSDITR
jgi:hypothetical protein